MKKKSGGHSHSSHSHDHHAHEKKLGPKLHDSGGYHHLGYGRHRLNIGAHRLDYTHKPCKNRKCNSYGKKHPNCKCKFAHGGVVDHFCASEHMHEGGCAYYKGGEVKHDMKGMNLANFKKIKEDNKTVTMGHPNGHMITIAKSGVTALQRKQMERLPLHLDEGSDGPIDTDNAESEADARRIDEGTDYSTPAQISDDQSSVPNQVPQHVADSPPAQNQIPLSNDPTKGLPNVSIGDVYGKSLAGIKEKQAAETQLAQNTADIERQQQANIQSAQDHWLTTNAEMQKNIGAALQDVKDGHINPNHYQESLSTGQRVTQAIGLLLGGFQGGFNRTGVNPAAQWVAGQINRDIDAQKVNLSNKETVYHGFLDQYKNAAVADQMARATQLGIYASKIREAGAKAGTPMAKANADIAASELERNIIPLINNAHLTNQFANFNSGTAGNGSDKSGPESHYKVALNAAQRINSSFYKDQQDKYIPGIGVASHPVAQADRERLSDLDSLLPLIDNAVADQKKYGMTGATLSAHPIINRADAAADEQALQVKLNKLTGLNRLNDREYQNYGSQIGRVGGMNLGGTLETLNRLKAQAISDRNSAFTSMGIKPFSDAPVPSGLIGPQQRNLQIFLKNNPKVDPGTAKEILKKKGLL